MAANWDSTKNVKQRDWQVKASSISKLVCFEKLFGNCSNTDLFQGVQQVEPKKRKAEAQPSSSEELSFSANENPIGVLIKSKIFVDFLWPTFITTRMIFCEKYVGEK